MSHQSRSSDILTPYYTYQRYMYAYIRVYGSWILTYCQLFLPTSFQPSGWLRVLEVQCASRPRGKLQLSYLFLSLREARAELVLVLKPDRRIALCGVDMHTHLCCAASYATSLKHPPLRYHTTTVLSFAHRIHRIRRSANGTHHGPHDHPGLNSPKLPLTQHVRTATTKELWPRPP